MLWGLSIAMITSNYATENKIIISAIFGAILGYCSSVIAIAIEKRGA